MGYHSTTLYCTSNEAGEQQVEIEYEKTFFQWLFRLPETKQVFVGSGSVWYEKGTGKRAGTLKESEIMDVVEHHRQRFKCAT